MLRFYFVLFVSTLSLTVNAQVKVTVRNTTGDRLISVILNGKSIGIIENHGVKTIEFDTTNTKHNLPNFSISAIRRGEKFVSRSKGMRCGNGTSKTVIESGYNMDIVLNTNATGQKEIDIIERRYIR